MSRTSKIKTVQMKRSGGVDISDVHSTERLGIDAESSDPTKLRDPQFGARYATMTNGLFGVLLLLVIAGMVVKTEADPDLWGHLRFGHEISQNLALSRADPYSFTTDRQWVNHEWLAEVIMAAVYDRYGTPGLLGLTTGITVGVLFLIWRLLEHLGVRLPVRAGLLVLVFMGISSQLASVRPQMFSVLLFTTLACLLVRSEDEKPRLLLVVPAIFAAWSNLHGGWIVGLGALCLWALPAALGGRVALPWLFFALISASLATLLNPYGIGLWNFLWHTVRLARPEIQDWQPLIFFPRRLVSWVATTVVVVWGWRRKGAISGTWFVPVAMLGLLSLKVVRLDVFYTLFAVTVLGRLVSGLGPSWFPLSKRPSRREILVFGAAATVAVTMMLYQATKTARCLPLMDSSPEPEAAQFVEKNQLTGKLLTWFGYGEYAIWHFWPNLRVSYDGRRETTYSDAVGKAHLAFYFGSDPSYARELNADFVWLKKSLTVVPALEADGWRPIFRGSQSVILTRTAGDYILPDAISGPRCFPGP